jgi:hypothetical protein
MVDIMITTIRLMNMNIKKLSLILSLVLVMAINAMAQDYGMLAQERMKKTYVRWMPLSYKAWQASNKAGVKIMRGSESLGNFRPLSASFFSKHPNPYMKVAGNLLYPPTPVDTTDMEGLDFSFGLAMQMSYTSTEVAEAMGLLYIDSLQKSGTTYTLMFENKPITSCKVSQTPIKIVRDLKAFYADSLVTLRWEVPDTLMHTSYILERSDDGGASYKSVTDSPILITAEPDSLGKIFMTASNKVPFLRHYFYYRVKALTPFGFTTPGSAVAQIFAYQNKLQPPKIKSSILPNGHVVISWEHPDSLAKDTRGYEIMRSTAIDKPMVSVTKGLLNRNLRSYTDTTPLSSAYYVVEAIDWAGDGHPSIVEYVQAEDSIPPAKPVLTHHMVTEKGIVYLKWKGNHEPDFEGYSVYSASHKKAEFSLLTTHLQKDSVFHDTLSLQMLNKEVYYTVVAFDNKLNASVSSDTVLVLRPDILPPAPPNFTGYEAADTHLQLSWVASPSADLKQHLLYRRAFTDSAWVALGTFLPDVLSIKDTSALEKVEYQYKLVAQDQAGLLSPPVFIRGKRLFTGIRAALENVNLEPEADGLMLSWKAPSRKVQNYRLYRQEADKDYLALYKVFAGNFGKFLDAKVQKNTVYKYRIQAVYEDNSESQLTEIISGTFSPE